MDTPAKLSFVCLLCVAAFTLPWQVHSFVIAGVILLVALSRSWRPFSSGSARVFRRFLLYAVALSALIVLANGILTRDGDEVLSLGSLRLSGHGLIFGLSTSLRLLILSFGILAFFVSTPLREFARYLDTIGLPDTIVSVFLLSLYFLEHLPRRINQIFVAQEARGAPVRSGAINRSKAFFTILSPLVMSSIIESVDRGMALELRGFHLRTRNRDRSSHLPGTLSPLGWMSLLLAAALVVVRIAQWLSP